METDGSHEKLNAVLVECHPAGQRPQARNEPLFGRQSIWFLLILHGPQPMSQRNASTCSPPAYLMPHRSTSDW